MTATETIHVPADFGDELDYTQIRAKAYALDPTGSAHLVGDGTKADNDLRAAWGFVAVDAFARRTFGGNPDGEEMETILGDLMADLLHFCDAVHVDFDEVVERGRHHYDCEVAGDI